MPESLLATKETNLPHRPGGPIVSRPLHFIWLVDGSGSMQAGGKMEAVNAAIRQSIPALRQAARKEPKATLYLNAIRFGDDARWLTERLTPVWEFEWADVEASGLTAFGTALTMVGEALQPPLILGRAFPPILLLITDGLPTDDFRAGLDNLLERPWGRRSLRLAVALGKQAENPEAREFLQAFVSPGAPPIIQANGPSSLTHTLRWAATVALQSVCSPDARDDDRETAGFAVDLTEETKSDRW